VGEGKERRFGLNQIKSRKSLANRRSFPSPLSPSKCNVIPKRSEESAFFVIKFEFGPKMVFISILSDLPVTDDAIISQFDSIVCFTE
jgi:hypothetical protein